ncbi:eIF2A-related protein [Dictyobacter kobayashii]|uniref:HTH cro/C1-type domain-containing protein n=1 Tax=Dictyobacter kobayashii TaxID=2014872 RepID=A0A402ARX8_9CHLR|nr:helix-turn-helix domain-containing protein [Dictyobacter kobayashii]GCE21854.1 hypothetical protein KDK_56540 [Dictyobacter kobayashii]
MYSDDVKKSKLRRARELRGWSQANVADKLGCDARSVGRWERGEISPSPHYRQQLCFLFEQNAEELGLVEASVPATLDVVPTEVAHTEGVPEPFHEISLPTRVHVPPAEEKKNYGWPMLHKHRSWFLLGLSLLLVLAIGGIASKFLLPGSSMSLASKSSLLYTYKASSLVGIYDVEWSPNGNSIACVIGDNTARVLTHQNGKYTLTTTISSSEALSWSPDGSQIASVTGDTPEAKKAVQIWNSSSGQIVYRYPEQHATITDVAWSPDGTRIAWSDTTGTVFVWTALTHKLEITYRGHKNQVWWIAWSPNSRYIASGSEDTSVQVWDAATGTHLVTYRGHAGIVYGVSWSPDGSRIASASTDRTVQIWQATTGKTPYLPRPYLFSASI